MSAPRVPAGLAAQAHAAGAVALADLRERVRRPAYLVVLGAAIGLGLLAAPAADARWVILDAGGWRGRYDSAWTGTVIALAAALWLLLGGFYVLRDGIERDERGGVGELLAATPLTRVAYLAGKFGSNLLVLASMTGVLAGTAVVLQLARGESRALDPVALLSPFLLLTLPVLAVTAAAAVLFGTVRPLRAGLGNVVWFCCWMVAVIVGQGAGAPLGGLGSHRVAASIAADLGRRGVPTDGAEFSLGLTARDAPLRVFDWSGLHPDAGFVAARLLLLLLAAGLAVLPALWFTRFDPARGRYRPAPEGPAGHPDAVAAAVPGVDPGAFAVPGPFPAQGGVVGPGPFAAQGGVVGPGPFAAPGAVPGPGGPVGYPAAVFGGRPRTPASPGVTAGRLLTGELRVLVQGLSRWWWAGVALLAVGAAVAPAAVATRGLLLAAWIWPILVWSRLGTQAHAEGVEPLLAAHPRPYRRVVAQWAAGVALTGVVGGVPALRMLAAGDGPGLAAWAAAALLLPAGALALGALTRSPRPFQVGWLALWWAAVNGLGGLDVTGAVRQHGLPAGPAPLPLVGAAAALLAVALLAAHLRETTR
ncbi:hypothetical protein [Micromonospora sp. NBC_01412]|uniref:hypothetical protein n=1 Tax=Micromonospora sp. NBC_01412 TaxID=2903590 RepID=UPI003249C51A